MKSRLMFVASYPQYAIHEDPPAGGTPPVVPPVGKVFTQEEVAAMVSSEKKRADELIRKTAEQLETIKQTAQLTDQEKKNLAERIESLNNELLSKEQLAAKERERLANEHQTAVQGLSSERDAWRTRYEKAEIERGIVSAATKHEAVDDFQIASILNPITSMVEVKDASGNGTGIFTPRVKFPSVDKKDGKPITLDLTIEDSVKLMKETPERFGNLFKSGLKAGLGMGGGTGGRTVKDLKSLSPSEYRQIRKEAGMTNT